MRKHSRPWHSLLSLASVSIVVQAADPITVQSLAETTTKLQI